MPYITQAAREELFQDRSPNTAGELNFVLTDIIWEYWNVNGKNYQAFNDIIGALEACKLELYRRQVVPYENKKIEENGDVY